MITNLKMQFSNKVLKGVDIEPCPFCGSVDNLVITSDRSFYELYGENGDATIVITCDKCYVDMYEHDYHGNNYDYKSQILIEKWNLRGGTDL